MSYLANIEEILKKRWPQGQILVEDMTGTQDHLSLTVIDIEFRSMPLIKQHRLVMETLEKELKGKLHAVKIKTQIPQGE